LLIGQTPKQAFQPREKKTTVTTAAQQQQRGHNEKSLKIV